MTLEELENVVALVCGRRVKFEIKSQGWHGKDKWIVHMYEERPYPGAKPGATFWRANTGWHAYGPTYKQAMEHAEEVALAWADCRDARVKEKQYKNKGWYYG